MLDRARRLEVAKGEALARAGDARGRAFHVPSGCLRSYVIDRGGKEHTMQFAPEDWYLGDMKSMMRDVPATIFIAALEPSVVHEMDSERAREALTRDRTVRSAMFMKLHNHVIMLQDRIIDLLASTGEERYLRFIKTDPGLLQRLPQKLIASYLGITPESLSRNRRSIAGQGQQA